MSGWSNASELSLLAQTSQAPWADFWDDGDDWVPGSPGNQVLEENVGLNLAVPAPLCNSLSQDVKAAVEEIDSIVNELWRTALPNGTCQNADTRTSSLVEPTFESCSPPADSSGSIQTHVTSNENQRADHLHSALKACVDSNGTTEKDRKKFKCDKCDKCYMWQPDLVKHQKAHSGKRYKCPECAKSYVLKSDLRKHLKSHQVTKAFLCKHCGKSFLTAGDLQKHIRIHTGEKPYFCNICNKSFSANDNFNKHLKIHAGDKPLVCADCGQRFSKKSNLQQHIRIHLGEKPFQCETCGLSFTQKTHLKTHISTHSGLKPYFCSSCNQRFTRNADLKRHITRAHSKRTENRGL